MLTRRKLVSGNIVYSANSSNNVQQRDDDSSKPQRHPGSKYSTNIACAFYLAGNCTNPRCQFSHIVSSLGCYTYDDDNDRPREHTAVAFASEDRFIIIGAGNLIVVFDVTRLSEQRTYELPFDSPDAKVDKIAVDGDNVYVAFSGSLTKSLTNGKVLNSAPVGSILMINLPSEEVVWPLVKDKEIWSDHPITALYAGGTMSDISGLVYVGLENGTFDIIVPECKNGSYTHEQVSVPFPVKHVRAITSIVQHDDVLFTGSADRNIGVWKLTGCQFEVFLPPMDIPPPVWRTPSIDHPHLGIDPHQVTSLHIYEEDGKDLLMAVYRSGIIRTWDITNPTRPLPRMAENCTAVEGPYIRMEFAPNTTSTLMYMNKTAMPIVISAFEDGRLLFRDTSLGLNHLHIAMTYHRQKTQPLRNLGILGIAAADSGVFCTVARDKTFRLWSYNPNNKKQ